jgi:hypothetical protein
MTYKLPYTRGVWFSELPDEEYADYKKSLLSALRHYCSTGDYSKLYRALKQVSELVVVFNNKDVALAYEKFPDSFGLELKKRVVSKLSSGETMGLFISSGLSWETEYDIEGYYNQKTATTHFNSKCILINFSDIQEDTISISDIFRM